MDGDNIFGQYFDLETSLSYLTIRTPDSTSELRILMGDNPEDAMDQWLILLGIAERSLDFLMPHATRHIIEEGGVPE
jgi:hypothetical protein